ncbi:hypothetical protein Lal_00031647 [Lupinus albus]|nr:hypothetical protein Lal_00031647 [Lupinus albus]
MSDANEIEAVNILTPEFQNSLSTSSLLNHNIELKVGTPIMLLKNLDQTEGLCNSTRLTMTKMTNHVLEAKIISGKNIGHIIYIPRMSMSSSQSSWPFKLIRRQFSIIVSVQSKKGLKILIHDNDGKPLKSTTNMVYKEVFQNL